MLNFIRTHYMIALFILFLHEYSSIFAKFKNSCSLNLATFLFSFKIFLFSSSILLLMHCLFAPRAYIIFVIR